MRIFNLILIFCCIYLSFSMQANAMSIYTPPAQISCLRVGFDSEQCEGFDGGYLQLSNYDSHIPRTPVILNFVNAFADYNGYSTMFFYNDNDYHYVAVLGPANSLIRAKTDDPAWIKKNSGSYYCSSSNPSGQCPIYLR